MAPGVSEVILRAEHESGFENFPSLLEYWITQPCMGFANKTAPGVSEGILRFEHKFGNFPSPKITFLTIFEKL